MFGVGPIARCSDLWRVREVGVPGALLQMGVATALGFALGRALGLGRPASLVLGVSVSVASTVVLVRALMDRGLLDSPHGKVARLVGGRGPRHGGSSSSSCPC